MPSTDPNRRPLKTRNKPWASSLARGIARIGVTPNQISVVSILFAALAGAGFVLAANAEKPARLILLFSAAAGIQLRLLCNMLDGMVAIEGGLRSKVGDIYNELPDRFADVFILVGAGHASRWLDYSPTLGWAAAVLAVITAYCRALGVVAGASQQFCGPMAKPHRMATLTVASLLAIGEAALNWPARIIPIALIVIIAGSTLTVARRTSRILNELNSK